MSASLDNVVVGDAYTDAATIQNLYGGRGGNMTVANASVYVQLQYGLLGTSYWTDEFAMVPSTASIDPGVIGIKFRNFTAGTPARVAVYLAGPQDPVLGASQIFTGTLSSSGSVTFNAATNIYGDGSDGAVTLISTTPAPAWATKSGTQFTLTRDVYFTHITLTGVSIKTAGFRLFANDRLVIDASSSVHNDGADGGVNGSGVNAGGAGTVGTVASGAAGGAGASGGNVGANGNTSANSLGGAGGVGGKGGQGNAGGTAGGANQAAATKGKPRNLVQAITGRDVTAAVFTGGGGGGGGGSGSNNFGGGGAAGGGVCVIVAKEIVNAGTMSADGGHGADGIGGIGVAFQTGGGGGGGGGVLIIVYGPSSTLGTYSAAGGTRGLGNPLPELVPTSADGNTGVVFLYAA